MANYDYEQFLNQDDFYMRDLIISETPSIRLFVMDSLLMKNSDKFYKYKNENLISVDINGEISKVSATLLYDLISNEGMFKYLITSLNKDYDTAVSIQLFQDNTIVDTIKVTKAELVLALNQLDLAKIERRFLNRLALIHSLTNLNVAFNNYSEQMYSCYADGEERTMKAEELIKLLSCSNKEFRKYINDKENLPYSKEIIMYILVDFCEKENIFKKYVFDERVYQRYKELTEYKKIDFESINKNRKSDDNLAEGKSLLDLFDINKELSNALYKDLPQTYGPLEKAIYLYIRLCDLLSYDDEHYISNSRYEKEGNHSEIESIYNITPKNNKIVSYEFMLIYAKLLRDLGIKYAVNLNSMAGYVYEKSSIKFKHGEYLVSVDLFDDIIKNDMSMVKIGGTLNSIKSYNKNDITHRKFEELLYKIYNDYRDSKERRKEFLDSVKEYRVKYFKSTASKKDKLYMLFKLIARKDLKGIDSINYIRETLFNVIGEDDDLSFDIYVSNQVGHFTPVVVISYLNDNDPTYYIIDVNSDKNIQQCDYHLFNKMLKYKVLLPFTEQRMLPVKEGGRLAK